MFVPLADNALGLASDKEGVSGTLYCYNHRRMETGLSCIRCARPICVRCLRQSEVGGCCPDCAPFGSAYGSPVNTSPRLHLIDENLILQGLAAGLVLGLLGMIAVTILSEKQKRTRRLAGALIGAALSLTLLVSLDELGIEF